MGKKVLFILMPKGFKDTEFFTPYRKIKEAGHEVDVAGISAGTAQGADSGTHKPNVLLTDLSDKEFDAYDALVIPGGPGSTVHLWGNKALQDVVRYFYDQKKIVATICYACIVLAEADLLEGKSATVYPTDEAKQIFAEHNVTFVDEGCMQVGSERIIMAQSPKFAEDFAHAILELLAK